MSNMPRLNRRTFLIGGVALLSCAAVPTPTRTSVVGKPAERVDAVLRIGRHDVHVIDALLLTGAEDQRAFDALRDGTPVLVVNETLSDEGTANIGRVFGFGAAAQQTLIRKSTAGAIAIDSSNELGPAETDAWLSDCLDTPRLLSVGSAFAADSSPDPLAPIVRLTHTWKPDPKVSVTTRITVLRDYAPSRDRKVIMVTSETRFSPQSGLLPVKKPNGQSKQGIIIPGRYAVAMHAFFAKASDPPLKFANLVEQLPATTGSTEINVKYDSTRTVGFKATISGDIAATDKGIVPKAGGAFEFNASHTESYGVSYTVSDYRIHSTTTTAEGTWARRSAHTDFLLGDHIAQNWKYFDQSGESGLTPMMHAAQVTHSATWEVDGEYSGPVWLSQTASYSPIGYIHKDDMIYPQQVESFPKNASQPTFGGDNSLFIDLDSPFLTVSPTVLIRSLVGDGSLLTSLPSNQVGLISGTSPFNKQVQWNFDAEGRYINRGLKLALSADADGSVTLKQQSLSLGQRIQWTADRVHFSNQTERDQLRLINRGGAITASPSSAGLPPEWPSNPLPQHLVVPPWGSYPLVAKAGDIIPNLRLAVPIPIPNHWVGLGPVTRPERWDIIVLRLNI